MKSGKKKKQDLPSHLIKEISHFFAVYKELEGKKTEIGQLHAEEDTRKIIREAKDRFGR